ncbi:MAG: hypothetical protein RSE50_00780 [Myroides sp.]
MDQDKETWILKKIEVEFQSYGEDKGKYTGKVSFTNGNFESFSFRIRPEMAENYIDLIADDLVKGAENLGADLLKSLKLKP